MKLPRVIGIAKAAAARRARLHPPTRVTLRCLVRDAAARVPKYKPKYCILCNAEFTPTSGKQLGRVLVNRQPKLTWMRRPTSVIGRKADMARTRQCDR